MTDESQIERTELEYDVTVAVGDESNPHASEIFDALKDAGVDVKSVTRQTAETDSVELWGGER